MEMALGEGLVLQAFYAMIETVDEAEVTAILKRGVKQEERHVEFGEQQTMKAIAQRPGLRRRLTGLNLVSLWGVRRLTRFMATRLPKDHPVLGRLPEFLAHTNACAELRMRRLGLIDRPLAEISTLRKAACVIEAYAAKLPGGLLSLATLPFRLLAAPFRRRRRLTDTYLDDPHIQGIGQLPPPRERAA
jgi:hypothetical protein